MCANAATVTRAAPDHPAVVAVRYPARRIAARQMRAMGSLVSLTFADAAAAERFLGAPAFACQATSFGGAHSLAERRDRWDDTVHPGPVRFFGRLQADRSRRCRRGPGALGYLKVIP